MVKLSHPTGDPDADPIRLPPLMPPLMPGHASLGPAEVAAVATAVAGNPRWCVIPHQDVGGEMMAMVLAEGDADLPTWIVHREGALLRLDVCRPDPYTHQDAYTRVGAYPALASLLASLHAAMAAEGGPHP